MKLFQDILKQTMMEEEYEILFSHLKLSPSEIIEMKCYQALRKIKLILEDDSLNDTECFSRIESIVCILEELGSDGGSRHDF